MYSRCSCSRARPGSWDTFFSKVFWFQESLVATAQDLLEEFLPASAFRHGFLTKSLPDKIPSWPEPAS